MRISCGAEKRLTKVKIRDVGRGATLADTLLHPLHATGESSRSAGHFRKRGRVGGDKPARPVSDRRGSSLLRRKERG